MTNNRIPCSVQVLTRNSAEGLKRCLDSLTAFDEVIVQDGYSTDGTRAIAQTFPNVHVVDQDKSWLDEEGRICEYAAIRNQGLQHVSFRWIFYIDSDERIELPFVDEVRSIVQDAQPGAYQVFRRFIVNGMPVDFCSAYPAYHIRLFHRDAVTHFIKSIHERIELREGVVPKTLKSELLVPLPPPQSLNSKYQRYLRMEQERTGRISMDRWFRRIALRNLRTVVGITLRAVLLRLQPKSGFRMPWRYEWQAVRYAFQVMAITFPLRHRPPPS